MMGENYVQYSLEAMGSQPNGRVVQTLVQNTALVLAQLVSGSQISIRNDGYISNLHSNKSYGRYYKLVSVI